MENLDKEKEEQKENAENEETKENKEHGKKDSEKSESEPIKIKIGTVGNFIFAAFIVLILGTGALTF